MLLGFVLPFNQSGNFELVSPFQSVRQTLCLCAHYNQSGKLCACAPISINQAGNFELLSFFHSSLSYYSLVALFICAYYSLCALFVVRFIHLCALYILCIIYLCTRFNGTELAINQSLLKVIDDHI